VTDSSLSRRNLLGRSVVAGAGAAALGVTAYRDTFAQATPQASAAGCDPLAILPAVPAFTVTSTDVQDGQLMALPQMSGIFGAGGQDASPQLAWSGFPAETKSFCVVMYDADASTMSGFWHWAVADIPGTVNELATGAGAAGDAQLPAGAYHLPNDARMAQYVGAAPPATEPPHRYYIVISALDTDKIGVAKDATPALLGFNIGAHILARAAIVPIAQGKG
jgi:Raf kinase inhibitor-like YbhB/YbcL family protein